MIEFPGWHLIGAFPDGEPNDVGSWLLHNNSEAMLLEVPPGLTVAKVKRSLQEIGCKLLIVAASHDHYDHLAPEVWMELQRAFGKALFREPGEVKGDSAVFLGGELLWQVKAPKHSDCDVVTVFRGVAMTGDIELGTLDSVNDEVPLKIKRKSMEYLRTFQERTSYSVHSIVSAHLNDVRTNVDWRALFTC